MILYNINFVKNLKDFLSNDIFYIKTLDNICIKYYFRKDGILNNKRLSNDKLNIYKNYLLSRFNDSENIKETLYRLKFNIYDKPKCPTCLKHTKWLGKNNYQKFCSIKCAANNPDVKTRREKTNIEKYGSNNVFKSDIIKRKIKQTCLERYGDENYRNKEKSKQTCLEKYGKEHILQLDFIKEKSKQTCLEKYGVTTYSQTDKCVQTIKTTKLERYGDENYNNREKAKQTCLEKYGVTTYSQTEECKNKTIKTNLEKYNCRYLL